MEKCTREFELNFLPLGLIGDLYRMVAYRYTCYLGGRAVVFLNSSVGGGENHFPVLACLMILSQDNVPSRKQNPFEKLLTPPLF